MDTQHSLLVRLNSSGHEIGPAELVVEHDFNLQDLSRLDLTLETGVLNPSEQRNARPGGAIARAVGDQQRPGLKCTFSNQHAGHYRMIGEMSIKEARFRIDPFDRDRPVCADLHHFIDEEKRRTMRDGG